MTSTTEESRTAGAVRDRLHEAAVRLFAEHGFSGTSLQMIADELGVTKAAVYYHYRSKDELLLGVVTPIIERLASVVRAARLERGRRVQVEVLLAGLIDILIDARLLYLVVASDPSYAHLQHQHPKLQEVGGDLLDVFYGPAPDAETRIATNLLLRGLVGPLNSPDCSDIPDDELRRILLENGRRLLLARRPTSPAGQKTSLMPS